MYLERLDYTCLPLYWNPLHQPLMSCKRTEDGYYWELEGGFHMGSSIGIQWQKIKRQLDQNQVPPSL